MNPFPSISVLAAVGKPDLIGIAGGRAALEALIDAAKALAPARWVAVDFSGMAMVSASAAREAVLSLGVFLNERGALPVLVNLNRESHEEIAFAAEALGQPILAAAALYHNEPSGLHILGSMDAKQVQTLRVVARLGEADAKSAHEASDDSSSTGVTAWNNRLSILAGMRFLQERKAGKTKYYSLTLKGFVDGN